jgi:CheY-like chemotaxis protein
VAVDGNAGLEAATASRPDVILLDVLLPDLSGYEVCRRLRANETTRAMPILMLTALQDRADRLQALEAGADDFLSKPVDRAELLARLRSLLRQKHLYDELARHRDEIARQAELLAVQYAVTRVLAEAATLEQAAPRLLQAIGDGLTWEWSALSAVDAQTGRAGSTPAATPAQPTGHRLLLRRARERRLNQALLVFAPVQHALGQGADDGATGGAEGGTHRPTRQSNHTAGDGARQCSPRRGGVGTDLFASRGGVMLVRFHTGSPIQATAPIVRAPGGMLVYRA